MKYLKISLVVLLNLALTSVLGVSSIEAHGVGTHSAGLQAQSTALERGYRTGYSDGYQAGVNDVAIKAAREVAEGKFDDELVPVAIPQKRGDPA